MVVITKIVIPLNNFLYGVFREWTIKFHWQMQSLGLHWRKIACLPCRSQGQRNK